MHWTFASLLFLSVTCILLNAVSALLLKKIYVAGLLICIGWIVQQMYWLVTGEDSFALFLASDAIIIGYLLLLFFKSGISFSTSERIIAASIPFTTSLGAYAWLNEGHTLLSWWANWWIVAGQMLIGLPPITWFFHRIGFDKRANFDPWSHLDLKILGEE